MSGHHRPRFHVRPASGWVNDPNAPVQVGGTYHLFCQHNPGGPVHGEVHWAHFSSRDLVHWTTHPIALAPRPGGPDEGGCWSGSAVLVDGEPWLVYSGYLDHARHQTVCVARPLPGWERWVPAQDTAVMQTPPEAGELTEFRDPFVWAAPDGYRMLMGAGYRDCSGVALLYRSQDLRSWTAMGPFCGARHPVVAGHDTGDVWECPQLLVRGRQALLVLSAWRTDGGPSHVMYASGRLVDDRLEPDVVGRLDHGPDFYAPALTVDSTGRCVLWGGPGRLAPTPTWLRTAGPACSPSPGSSGWLRTAHPGRCPLPSWRACAAREDAATASACSPASRRCWTVPPAVPWTSWPGSPRGRPAGCGWGCWPPPTAAS